MSCLCQRHRHFDLFRAPHLSEQDDLRILTHRSDERRPIIRNILPDLFLLDDRFPVRMDVLYRVFDGDDMLGLIGVDLINHRGEGRGFS